jgi:uncharacterized protein (DUF1778 family)
VATKDERLEMRLSKADRDMIEDAAALVHENVSDFTRSAVLRQAQRVLARAELTLMPAEQFDDLLYSLDQPDQAPTLARKFAEPRRFKRA